MIKREDVQAIVDKYDGSYNKMTENATYKEFKMFLMFLAQESNRKQRELAGYDD
jgi:hypothetical protein